MSTECCGDAHMHEVADHFELRPSRIAQIEKRALDRLRAARAGALLDEYIANGTTLVRTHVDVDNGVTAIEGVIGAAKSRADAIDVQVVAFPQSGMLVAPGTVELLDAAMSAGAHLIGGIDPAGFDGDPVGHLDAIFAIAERHGCGVDLHLHDRGALGRWELELVIERTRALDMTGMVTVSHAFCLCDGDPAVPALVEQLGEHRIALATVAPGNVDPLPLDVLDHHDVAVCLGQDGIRVLWSPWGDADMLARAGLMAWRRLPTRRRHRTLCRHRHEPRRCRDRCRRPRRRSRLPWRLGSRRCRLPAEAAVTAPPRTAVVKAGQIVDVEAIDRGRR